MLLALRSGFCIYVLGISSFLNVMYLDDAYAVTWERQDKTALEAFKQKKYRQAAKTFTDPYRKGVAWYRAKDYQKAEQAFKAVQRQEMKLKALYNLGNTQMQTGQYTKAQESYQQVLEKQANNEDAQYNLKLAKQLSELDMAKSKKEQHQKEQNKQQQNQQKEQQESKEDQQSEQQNKSGESAKEGKSESAGEESEQQDKQGSAKDDGKDGQGNKNKKEQQAGSKQDNKDKQEQGSQQQNDTDKETGNIEKTQESEEGKKQQKNEKDKGEQKQQEENNHRKAMQEKQQQNAKQEKQGDTPLDTQPGRNKKEDVSQQAMQENNHKEDYKGKKPQQQQDLDTKQQASSKVTELEQLELQGIQQRDMSSIQQGQQGNKKEALNDIRIMQWLERVEGDAAVLMGNQIYQTERQEWQKQGGRKVEDRPW